MNERIRELRDKCVDPEYGWVDVNKFAELIVRECSKISTELCNELKADESIQTPGSKTNWNLYMISLRNKLSESFEIGGVES